jgi:penicillin-binding protein 1C
MLPRTGTKNCQPEQSASQNPGQTKDRRVKTCIYRYLLAVVVIIGFVLFWRCLPAPLFDAPFSWVLLDRDGELLGATTAGDQQWRFPSTSRVPDKFARAITCFEDRRFFHHPGVDPLAVLRALRQNFVSRRAVSGASTITMQVIRLSRFGRSRTLTEKLLEMVMALRLEVRLSKQQILALYASHAPFGGNVVGLEAAAWRYFGRAPDRLSWAESALLAVLPNNPALIHPGRNRQILLTKRNRLLDRMQRHRIIDALTCQLAQAEPLPPKPFPLPRLAPHLLARLQLTQQGFKVNGGNGSKYSDGQRIRTTLRRDIQHRSTQVLDRHHRGLVGNGIHNAAALILEVASGNVLAYVGNVSATEQMVHGNQVDIITAPRSTGSILKPLLYAAMLETGELLPDQLVADIPTRLGGFYPQNYSRTYQGAVPASRALARSLNVPAVRMLQSYGVDRFYAVLKKLGLRTLHRPARNYGLSLILGGAEGTLEDITAIYAGLARRVTGPRRPDAADAGAFFRLNYLAPMDVSRVGGSSTAGTPQRLLTVSSQPLGAAASWLTLKAMLEVTRPGVERDWKNFVSSRKIAWKTGTSYGHRDGWAVGVTPRYAVGVWVGNADGEGRAGLTGISAAAPILFELFGLLDGRRWFDEPDNGLVEVTVCVRSGHRAGPDCTRTRKMLIPRAGLRSQRCPYCRIIHSDASGQWRVHGACERIAGIRPVKRFVLPPVMEWYYRKTNSNYHPLPAYRSDCLALPDAVHTGSLSLIYPGKKGKIYVPIELNGRRGRTVFEAAHRNSGIGIFWHLDDRYLGATRDIHQMALAPTPGKHTLTLVDENGEQLQRVFTVLAKQ